MDKDWASDNLQVIRTLMERSAVYRRALAPIMIFAGAVGILGGLAGWLLKIGSSREFVIYWAALAALVMAGSFLLIRRQAIKDSEPFWSPPTRRVAQALTPPFAIGMAIGSAFICQKIEFFSGEMLISIWCWTYGCGIHAAGFFMPRGIKLLGWLFILTGVLLTGTYLDGVDFDRLGPHLLMAAIFGGLHLAYGIYLYFTEKNNPVA